MSGQTGYSARYDPVQSTTITPLMNIRPTTRRRFLTASGALPFLSLNSFSAEAKTYRVGVIGHTGRGDFGHGMDTLWKEVPATTVVAVSDPVEEGRAKAIKKLGLKPEDGFDSYQKLLDETHPDIVSVASRHTDQHHAMIMAAIKAGAKGIYVEKPFCRDLVEADEIVAACEASGTKLAIAHRNRYHPVLPVVKKLVEDGAIGTWLEVRLRGKEDGRGGSQDLWVLGSHLLNLANYFTGNPTSCSATVLQDKQPVTASDVIDGAEGLGPLAGNEIHARYETESGIPVFFDSIQKAGTRETGFGLQLVGTEGIIDFRADRNPLVQIMKGSPFNPNKEARYWTPISTAGIGKPQPDPELSRFVMSHQAAALDLIDCIENDGDPLCNERDGRVVLEMILGVFESHRQSGKRVEIPLQNRTNALGRL